MIFLFGAEFTHVLNSSHVKNVTIR
jgi:hypothetical protein